MFGLQQGGGIFFWPPAGGRVLFSTPKRTNLRHFLTFPQYLAIKLDTMAHYFRVHVMYLTTNMSRDVSQI